MTLSLSQAPKTVSPFAQDIHEAQEVLRIEIQGLIQLAETLDDAFAKAVDMIFHAKGRVIITGMGKSGHVGKKIASTLASTGTPSFFMHPAEASHGDLGMIQREDILLAISNSGETQELAEVICFCKSHGVPIIAMTREKDSSLGTHAEVVISLPKAQEACPLDMAPTTSSLMTLALGDALAMVLLKRRGFTDQDFGRLHPGGKLGLRLVQVDKVMVGGDDLPLVKADEPMAKALILMTAKAKGCLGVVGDKGTLVGMITDGDLRRHMDDGLLQKQARDIMTPQPRTLKANTLVEEAMVFFSQNGISGAFIVDDVQRPVGFVHIHDCIKGQEKTW